VVPLAVQIWTAWKCLQSSCWRSCREFQLGP
jgi:hypothetical protein